MSEEHFTQLSMPKKNYFYFFTILAVWIVSFFLYSSLFYPLLNSDNAVTILMVHYFKLPGDLYFWGQDRLGSLIPLLGQIPNKIFGLSPIVSESIVHYAILLAGFLAFSTFIKSNFYKVVFAIIWFFPPMRLIDVTQFAFGIHYSLIGIICYLINKVTDENKALTNIRYYTYLSVATILMIVTVWVSDMAIVSAVLLIFLTLLLIFKNKGGGNKRNKIAFPFFIVSGVIAGFLFIQSAKSVTGIKNTYSALGDPEMIKKSFEIFLKSVTEFLTFSSDEPITDIYTYLVLILIGSILLSLKFFKPTSQTKKWLIYFLIESILLFVIIMVSKWTFLNSVPRRYFTCTYITLSFSVILLLDNLELNKSKSLYFRIIALITVLVGGSGTIYNIKYFAPSSLTPMSTVLSDFEKLGNIGVISEYWNSYVTSCINPDLIKATPHDQTYAVRNYKIVEEVFQQPNIYIIRDMWMDSFPDSLKQFDRLLLKAGEEKKLGDCFVCRYELVK